MKEQIEEFLRSIPANGIYRQQEMPSINPINFSAVGYNASISLDVKVYMNDPYNPQQRLQVRGVKVTLYRNDGETISKTVNAEIESVRQALIELKEKTKNLCLHKNMRKLSKQECEKREISHYGMSYHVYECLDCRSIRTIDSSD